MKPSAKRRRGAAIVASLALAAGGVAWAGCGDDEEEAQDAAQEIEDQVNEALEDADLPEETQDAIDDAQDQANEAIDEVNDAIDEGDVQGAIEKAQKEAEQQSDEAAEQLEQALEDAGY